MIIYGHAIIFNEQRGFEYEEALPHGERWREEREQWNIIVL